MRLIGLTGGIASGKSTVSSLLAQRGATVIDADELAREVVEPGQPALRDIAERFGPTALQPDGALDRGAMGALVFADAEARRDLERITHPRIATLMQQRIGDALARDSELVVVDIPLLFENRRDDMFEGVMLVYAPERTQIERVMERDRIDEAAARLRLAAQMPIDEKRQRATWIIDNSDGVDATKAQVDTWWNDFAAGQL